MISSLSINLTRGMTHGRCTRWSELICTLSNCRCAIWGTCSSCGRAVVRWICHACPTGLVLIILERFQKMVDFIKKCLSKKMIIATKINFAAVVRSPAAAISWLKIKIWSVFTRKPANLTTNGRFEIFLNVWFVVSFFVGIKTNSWCSHYNYSLFILSFLLL